MARVKTVTAMPTAGGVMEEVSRPLDRERDRQGATGLAPRAQCEDVIHSQPGSPVQTLYQK